MKEICTPPTLSYQLATLTKPIAALKKRIISAVQALSGYLTVNELLGTCTLHLLSEDYRRQTEMPLPRHLLNRHCNLAVG